MVNSVSNNTPILSYGDSENAPSNNPATPSLPSSEAADFHAMVNYDDSPSSGDAPPVPITYDQLLDLITNNIIYQGITSLPNLLPKVGG